MNRTKYKIQVQSVTGAQLTYNVDSYTHENDFIKFYDKKDEVQKLFHSSNCEITINQENEEEENK